MKFGEKLRKLRQRQELSQKEVAEKIGISLRAYASYETQNVRPRKVETYKKLADVLKCDVNELLTEDSYKPGPMFYAGLGLFGIGTSLTGPIGAVVAAAATPLAYNIFNRVKKVDTYEEWAKEQDQLGLEYEKQVKRFSNAAMGILLTELGKKGGKCQVGEVKNLASKGAVPDSYIIVDGLEFDEWWLVFWCKENKKNEQLLISDEGRAYMLFSRFVPTVPDYRRKASIVVNDEEVFDEVCKLKGYNSYRGNLTAILVDTDEALIIKEETISSFDVADEDV